MKKIVFAVAMALGSLTAFAATPVALANTEVTVSQDSYKEIPVDKVPQAIQEKLQADHPGAEILKASVNEKKTYKIEVKVGKKTQTLLAKENGEWVKK